MRVYKDTKTGRWFVDYFWRGQRLRFKAGSSMRAADQLRLRIESEINSGKHNPEALRLDIGGRGATGLTLGRLVEQFLASYRSRGRTDYYEEKARRWLEQFGKDILVADIGPLQVERYRNARLEKASASTVRKDIISLGTLFRWAMTKGLAAENPADPLRVKRPREPAGESRALTEDEYSRLLEACPNWLAAIVRWACHTGMDKGMVQRLRWSDLELQRDGSRVVSGSFKLLRSKTGKPIRQVLSTLAIEALNMARRVRHASDAIFLDAGSQPIDEKALDWALGKALKAAELQGVNFRTFRHSFATWALRSGVHPTVLAKMMGHSTAFITERYMHVADDMLEKAAKLMGGSYMAVRKVRHPRKI